MVDKKRGVLLGIFFLLSILVGVLSLNMGSAGECTSNPSLNCEQIDFSTYGYGAQTMCGGYDPYCSWSGDATTGTCNTQAYTCADIEYSLCSSDVDCEWIGGAPCTSGVCCDNGETADTNYACDTVEEDWYCDGDNIMVKSKTQYCDGTETSTCTGSTSWGTASTYDTCNDPYFCNPADAGSSQFACDTTCGDGDIDSGETCSNCPEDVAVTETCNGVDDDCDGVVDDNLEDCCNSPYVTSQTCNNGDNVLIVDSCSSGYYSAGTCAALDGSINQKCCVDGTECVTGTKDCFDSNTPKECINGYWETQSACPDGESCSDGDCVPDCTPSTENCNDGVDNDCDNLVDIEDSDCQGVLGTCDACSDDRACSSGYCDSDGLCLPSSTSCYTGSAGSCTTYSDGASYTDLNDCEVTCNSGSWGTPVCPSDEPNFKAFWSQSAIELGSSSIRYAKDYNSILSGIVSFSGDGGTSSDTISTGETANGGSFTPTSIGTYSFAASLDGYSSSSTLTVSESSPVCGDGFKEGTEECDEGNANGDACTPGYNSPCSYCSDSCTTVSVSADGEPNDGTCDTPYEDCTDSDCSGESFCSSDCGNNVVETGEQCDDGSVASGGSNGVECNPAYDETCTWCSTACTTQTETGSFCGDGTCDVIEDSTSCSADCETVINVCFDYTPLGQDACENFNQTVADESAPSLNDNQYAECYWNESVCDVRVRSVSSDGTRIGTCSYSENPRTDSCEDDGFLTYSWDSDWSWDSINTYNVKPTDPDTGEDLPGYVEGSDGLYHYDPDGAAASCSGGQRSIPCPAQVKLPFFSWKNLAITIIVIGLIYLTVLELRKNRNKVSKIEEKKKEDYKKSKGTGKKKK